MITQITKRVKYYYGLNKPVRIYFTHANWLSWCKELQILKQTNLEFMHLYKKHEHTYTTDKSKIINAPFETVLFVHSSNKIPLNEDEKNNLIHLFDKL